MAQGRRRATSRLATTSCIMLTTVLILLYMIGASAAPPARKTADMSKSHTYSSTTVKGSPIQILPGAVKAIPPLPQHLKLAYGTPGQANETSNMLSQLCGRSREDRQGVDALTMDGRQSLTNWTEVQCALRCLPSVRNIYWQSDGLMPKLPQTLSEYLPSARLHLTSLDALGHFHWGPPHGHKRGNHYLDLMGSPAVESVKVAVIYGGEPAPQPMIDLHRLLTSWPHVTSLDLQLGHEGCVVSDGQPRAFNFEDRQVFHAPMPVLKELRLSGYAFDQGANGEFSYSSAGLPKATNLLWPFNRLEHWWAHSNIFPPLYFSLENARVWMFDHANSTSRFSRWVSSAYMRISGDHEIEEAQSCDFPCCRKPDSGDLRNSNLQAWLNRTSFSNITTLSLSGLYDDMAYALLFSAIDSLHELSIFGVSQCDAQKLLQHLDSPKHSLEVVSLRHFQVPFNDPGILIDALMRNQAALTSLSLQLINYLDVPWPARSTYLNTTHLARLASGLPNLTSLDVDIDRDQPHEAFDATVQAFERFSKLEELTLRSGSPGELYSHTGPDKLFNASSLASFVERLLPPVLAINDTCRVPTFRRLELLLGEWDRRHEHSMGGPEHEYVGRYVCKVLSNDSDSPSGSSPTPAAPRISCSGGLMAPDMWSGGVIWQEGPDSDSLIYSRKIRNIGFPRDIELLGQLWDEAS
ncbi:uncharacterized protein AB675_8756 [Cyphellophora attinorum]|uniref:F-box domain-containing protein n=1 Tax=Cyphellophora attinorum TaxID=1664694 RepID=A0A0N1P385_9EURO|nr:uncharacterized protein AB675_8756 [Phialophora attinorum]KPI44730.1 hypothetical protein AB675_8756 [Phialophora attinorum]